jgi:hypothetical protein
VNENSAELTIFSGDNTPNLRPVLCFVSGSSATRKNWSVDARAENRPLRFTSSKRSSSKAIIEAQKAILEEASGQQSPQRLIGLRRGALFVSRDHVDDLRCAFSEFEGIIRDAVNEGAEFPLIHALETTYTNTSLGERLQFGNAKQRPRFDSDTYPSLFFELPVLDGGRGVSFDDLPDSWTRTALSGHPKLRDPLVAMLLGFIWKQGDFPKVANVLEGLRGTALHPDDSVVLYQFGQHLANPMGEPIFDQHSSRAQWLLMKGFSQWESPNDFDNRLADDPHADVLFGPSDSRGQLEVQHLDTYKRWWRDIVRPVLPVAGSERLLAMQCIDKTMFSLGKAAVFLLRPASANGADVRTRWTGL